MAGAEKIDPEEKDFILYLVKSTISYRGFTASVTQRRVTTDTLQDVWPPYRGIRNVDGPWNMGTDVRVRCTTCNHLQSLKKMGFH